MKKIKKIWKNYKMVLLVELLVVVIMLVSAGMVYKQTYEFEYERAWSLARSVLWATEFRKESDRQVSDFLMNLQNNFMYDFVENNINNKYYGYGVTWEIYDKNDNVIERSTDNDLMLIWWGEKDKLNGQGKYYEASKAYLVEKYFTEEEMEGAWEFIFSTGVEDNGWNDLIEKVIGYYDANNEFVPVEIDFWDCDTKENYSLKSEENINKDGAEYITIKGNNFIAEEQVTADGEGEFSIDNLKKRKNSVNKAIEKVKEDGDYDYLNKRGYFYEEYDMLWDVSTQKDVMSSEEQSGPSGVRIGLCADLNYMVFNNTMFKIYMIIDIILCLLIGVGIIYIVRKNDEKRKYLDSMKYTFINAMAHEMKTPSAVIVNSVECINDGIKPEKQSKYLDKVKKEGLHMNRLLLDMLTYTKLTGEDRKIYKEEINMKELFEEVIEHYTDTIEKKNIEVQWNISSENNIMADRKLMEMVVDNYLSNAVKYCTEAGIIKITMDEKGVVVFNSGEPIYPTKQKAIWEPLYVMDESRKNREGSSGMGLAISAKIMDLHGMQYGTRNADDGVEFYIITK